MKTVRRNLVSVKRVKAAPVQSVRWTDQFTDRYSRMILDYNLKLSLSDEYCHRKTYYQSGMAVSK